MSDAAFDGGCLKRHRPGSPGWSLPIDLSMAPESFPYTAANLLADSPAHSQQTNHIPQKTQALFDCNCCRRGTTPPPTTVEMLFG